MNHTESIRPRLERIQQRSLYAGIAGLAICVLGVFIDREQFFRSYLLGYIYVLGIPLGALGITMLHNLTGGSWGYSIRRILESAVKTIPLMAALFVPIVFGLHSIYIWTDQNLVGHDELLQHKSPYLNVPFFLIRVAIYFAVWFGVSYLLVGKMRRVEAAGGPADDRGVQNFSAIGLLAFFLTATFAAFDWMMSLEPHWFSTIYGVMIIVGQVLSMFALSIAVLAVLTGWNPDLREKIRESYFHDLGNLLFAFTMLWAYLSLSQFLIIWSANLPEEVTWYVQRSTGGWGVIPIILVAFHFLAPFFLLLMRKTKRNPSTLAAVALVVLVMRYVDDYWLIAPSFHPLGIHLSWLDIVAPIGIGGIWLWMFIGQLKKETSLIPLNAPFLTEAPKHD
ncbi:MAG: hypothetical protein JWQ98_1631 [Chlorobi bacterium]|nr:hypothetical protein [Chlorobiota bacterium]